MPGTQQLDERVARLEEGLTTLSRDMSSLTRNVEAITTQMGALGRPDWGVIISGAFLILALFSAGLVPVYQRAGYALDAANEAKGWEEAFMRGQIMNPCHRRDLHGDD